MGTIVCQVCEGTIGHFEDEKSTVLYGKCGSHCECDHKEHTKAIIRKAPTCVGAFNKL